MFFGKQERRGSGQLQIGAAFTVYNNVRFGFMLCARAA